MNEKPVNLPMEFGEALARLARTPKAAIDKQELKQKNQEFLQRIQELEVKNKNLQQEGQFLRNNPEYLEKIAREKMGLIREGETVYKIVPEEKKK